MSTPSHEVLTSCYVTKRGDYMELAQVDKIFSHIKSLCYGLNEEHIDPFEIAFKVASAIYSGVSTTELDNLAAEVAASKTTCHPDYAILAARIAVSKLHKETKTSFSETMAALFEYHNPKTGLHSPMISPECYDVIKENSQLLNAAIKNDRDFDYTYFGFKTLERSYLLKIDGKVVERPQHMLMRVAIGIHGADIDDAIQTYELMSERWFTHASPTLFNAGTCRPQMSSCFLLTMASDSIEGIFKTVDRCARISKSAGGIGLNVHCIRAAGTTIAGTNGVSNGLTPMLRVFNNTARYVDQGGNKRPGAFAIYLEPWHADIMQFLELKKNTGNDEERARDLFYGLWIPDLFMQRVKDDEKWSLMCPHECPGLEDCWGQEFEELYVRYETEVRYQLQVKAREVWKSIISSQIETGTPYMLYKDACNRKSNQQNLGTIKCANLCTEIIQYSSPEKVAVCNLASIALNRFVQADSSPPRFDFGELRRVTHVVALNLNKIIDSNWYPLEEARRSNLRHRPIGIGVQGLADAFILMRLPYTSDEARLLNKQIFETIYYAALEVSCNLAQVHAPYETYQGSPVSKGILQYDMWGVTPTPLWDWASLKRQIALRGVRNSLLVLVAAMPTASTAQILGNNESFDPYVSNVFSRGVLSGDFQVVNPHLLKDLVTLGLWNEDLKNRLLSANGSVQGLKELPQWIKDLYKTAWEIPQKAMLEMAADRAPFIDQSQSLNLYLESPTYGRCTSMHFAAWRLGLKTGMYYLRSRPPTDPVKFTVNKRALSDSEGRENMPNPKQPKEDCLMCSA